MQDLGNMAFYLGLGAAGGLLGLKFKFPGSVIIFSMLAVMLTRVALQSSWHAPKYFILIIQIALGVMVGLGYTPELARQLGKVIIPVMASTLVLVFAGLIMAVVMVKLGLLNIPDAYLSTSPGAMSALLSLSLEESANPGIVAAFHFFRVIFIILTAPVVFGCMRSFLGKG